MSSREALRSANRVADDFAILQIITDALHDLGDMPFSGIKAAVDLQLEREKRLPSTEGQIVDALRVLVDNNRVRALVEERSNNRVGRPHGVERRKSQAFPRTNARTVWGLIKK